MEEDDRLGRSLVGQSADLGDRVGGDALPGPRRLPVIEHDVDGDDPIAETGQGADHPGIVFAGEERTAEPRPRIDPHDVAYRPLRVGHIRHEALVRQERQAGVIEGVAAHQVAVGDDPASGLGVRLDPAALEEEGRMDVSAREDGQHPVMDVDPILTVGMLGVECERDPHRHLPRLDDVTPIARCAVVERP